MVPACFWNPGLLAFSQRCVVATLLSSCYSCANYFIYSPLLCVVDWIYTLKVFVLLFVSYIIMCCGGSRSLRCMWMVVCCPSPSFVLTHVLIAFKYVPSRVFLAPDLLEAFLIYIDIFIIFLMVYLMRLLVSPYPCLAFFCNSLQSLALCFHLRHTLHLIGSLS